ncbi:unnamed protein product, partial [Hymenolepis diminuta]
FRPSPQQKPGWTLGHPNFNPAPFAAQFRLFLEISTLSPCLSLAVSTMIMQKDSVRDVEENNEQEPVVQMG